MWEEGVCIYDTPGVHNNFPNNVHNGVNDSNYVLSLKIDIKYNNGNI